MAKETAAQRARRLKSEAQATKDENNTISSAFGKQGIKAGVDVMDALLPKGSTGRIDTGLQMTKDAQGNDVIARDAQGNPIRTQETADVLNRYNDLSKGLDAGAYQATREQQQKGLDSDLKTQQQQLAKAQARGKVYGAAGAAQQANALTADSQKRADLEQQDKLANVGLINQGTKDYASQLNAQQAAETGKQEFNVQQTTGEAAARLSGVFNAGAMATGNRLSQAAIDVERQAIGRTGGGGGGATVKEPDSTPGASPTANTPPINTDPNRTNLPGSTGTTTTTNGPVLKTQLAKKTVAAKKK